MRILFRIGSPFLSCWPPCFVVFHCAVNSQMTVTQSMAGAVGRGIFLAVLVVFLRMLDVERFGIVRF